MRRHEVPAVISALQASRGQPEQYDALDVRIPFIADRLFENGSEQWVTPDLFIERQDHLPDQGLIEPCGGAAMLETSCTHTEGLHLTRRNSMVGLIDFAPTAETVECRVRPGYGYNGARRLRQGLANLLSRFSELRMLMTGQEVQAEWLMAIRGDAVAALVALGCGYPVKRQPSGRINRARRSPFSNEKATA